GTINPVGNLPRIDWSANVANGEHPIVLAQNEGIVINSAIAIPTTGTFVLGIECAWAEVESYMDAMGNPV
ncbi:MAG: hypothetical protein IPK85_04210, partial [Gemmatimonadetes bacterium]|nr:hypothetical protein [Gemmatimonadota bacterium]